MRTGFTRCLPGGEEIGGGICERLGIEIGERWGNREGGVEEEGSGEKEKEDEEYGGVAAVRRSEWLHCSMQRQWAERVAGRRAAGVRGGELRGAMAVGEDALVASRNRFGYAVTYDRFALVLVGILTLLPV